MASLNFNAETVEPQQSFEPIPEGRYTAMITDSEMKPTKSGAGAYLQLTFKVLEGEFTNRLVFTRLNLQNQNQTAVEIAYRQLSAICHAIGVIQVEDSQQLHGIPMQIKVVIRPGNDGYDPSNEIKDFKALEQAPAAPAKPAQTKPKAQTPAGVPPWAAS